MKNVNVNEAGGTVHWGFTTNNLTVGYFRAVVLGPNNEPACPPWVQKKTNDDEPDHFPIPLSAAQLKNCILWIQAIIKDPVGIGRKYTANIIIRQDGIELSNTPYPGTVPPGVGKGDLVADDFLFI